MRTTSGATAVQLVESVDGRRRIVRHVGSAHDEFELGLLMDQARQLLCDDAQGMLDLGITPVAVEALMVPPPARTLIVDDKTSARRQLVPRAVVHKTFSRLLFDVLAGVYTDLGFDAIADEVFRDLVIARVVEPTSLFDVDRVLADLGQIAASFSTRRRALRRCFDGDYRGRLAALCFTHASEHGDVSLCLFGVTTLLCRRRHNRVYADVWVMPMFGVFGLVSVV